jgi:hypothetical protein
VYALILELELSHLVAPSTFFLPSYGNFCRALSGAKGLPSTEDKPRVALFSNAKTDAGLNLRRFRTLLIEFARGLLKVSTPDTLPSPGGLIIHKSFHHPQTRTVVGGVRRPMAEKRRRVPRNGILPPKALLKSDAHKTIFLRYVVPVLVHVDFVVMRSEGT